MRVIEISEKKREKMSNHVEDALYAMGKVMAYLEELDGDMGERSDRGRHNMGGRDRYGNRHDRSRYEDYGDKDDWDDDDDDGSMGQRRRRRRRG